MLVLSIHPFDDAGRMILEIIDTESKGETPAILHTHLMDEFCVERVVVFPDRYHGSGMVIPIAPDRGPHNMRPNPVGQYMTVALAPSVDLPGPVLSPLERLPDYPPH